MILKHQTFIKVNKQLTISGCYHQECPNLSTEVGHAMDQRTFKFDPHSELPASGCMRTSKSSFDILLELTEEAIDD